jgi:hypothetical protein
MQKRINCMQGWSSFLTLALIVIIVKNPGFGLDFIPGRGNYNLHYTQIGFGTL